MKTLVLIRHAKSSWKNSKLSDHERPLNNRGKGDAPLLAERLRKISLIPDLLISSSAKRAIETANFFISAFEDIESSIVVPSFYESSLEISYDIIHNIAESHSIVFLVGHNPIIQFLSEDLCGQNLGHVPTCSAISIQFHVDTWQAVSKNLGVLSHFDYPKKT